MALGAVAVSPSVFRCQCQQLVDLARTMQEVAGLAGMQKHEQRLALIATELQSFAQSEFQPTASQGDATTALAPVHVSLRDLCSSNEDARAELRELRGLLAGTQQDLKGLTGNLEAQEQRVQELSSSISSLGQAQEAARATLEHHEAKLGAAAADQADAREAAKDSCQRTNCKIEELQSRLSSESGRLTSEVAEVRQAFESLEQELLESFGNHKQTLQTRQQQALEQFEELRFLSQQRHTEVQEQFKTFQQLMLSQQWEAKQAVDGELRTFQLQLDKALWQKNAADWAKSAEDARSPSTPAEPVRANPFRESQSSPREELPAAWRSVLEDVIRRSHCLCEQTKAETDSKLGEVETKLRKCMKSLLDEQLKINQRTYQEASQAQETGQLSAELVKAAEASFKGRLERSLLGLRSDVQRELESFKDSQQKVLGQVQQTLQSVGSDMEIAATSSARLGKSVKHLEVSVKDMSVSVAQHQADIDELKADSGSLSQTAKRVDDLWRHVEGVKSDLVSLERAARESRAELLALSYGKSAGTHGHPAPEPPLVARPGERRVLETPRFVEEPRAM